MKESGAINSEICHSTIHENLLQEPRESDITGEPTRYKTNTKDIESRSKTQYNFSLNVRRRVIFIWIKRKKIDAGSETSPWVLSFKNSAIVIVVWVIEN